MQFQIDHLEKFRLLFPVTRIKVFEEDMVYYFRNQTTAKYFEAMALKIILDNGLPLVAELSIWEKKGYVFEISMRVAYAPEMELIEM